MSGSRPGSYSALADEWPLSRCFRRGLEVGGGYATLQIIAAALGVDFVAEFGFGLGTALSLDFITGAAGGLLAGLLMPMIADPGMAALAGSVILLPAIAGFAFAAEGYSTRTLLTAAVVATLIGCPLGLFGWNRFRHSSR